MRHISIMLTLAPLPLAACEKKADAAKPAYDLTAASNKKYLADNAARPGVFKTADGLQYRVIKAGAGKTPQRPDDMVTVKYKGSLINGKVFDQTKDGQTASFPAGNLIPGWVEALSMMKEGDEWELVIPSDLGYGPEGAGKDIPGNQTLVFDMTSDVGAASARSRPPVRSEFIFERHAGHARRQRHALQHPRRIGDAERALRRRAQLAGIFRQAGRRVQGIAHGDGQIDILGRHIHYVEPQVEQSVRAGALAGIKARSCWRDSGSANNNGP